VDANGQGWLFAGWSDGGAATHSVTSPVAARTYTARYVAAARLAPTADAFVRGGTSAAVNYGTQSGIDVKRSAMADNMREGYLKFDLHNVSSIGIARLRLFGALQDTRNTNVPTAVYSVASSTWAETGLTWNNRPSGTSPALDTAIVANAVPSWHEWDVTSYLRAEKAAGRSTVSLVLRNTVTSSPATVFNAREASSNDPELFVASETSGSEVAGDIVLRAGDATTIAGLWRRLADTSAAGGLRLSQPDAGAPKRDTPLASPSNDVNIPFTAEAGQPYRLWIRGRAERDSYANDSAFVQFTNSVDQAGQPIARWRSCWNPATAAAWRAGAGKTMATAPACSGR
jgi:hypothetical protein